MGIKGKSRIREDFTLIKICLVKITMKEWPICIAMSQHSYKRN
jgi:hypothetical protein